MTQEQFEFFLRCSGLSAERLDTADQRRAAEQVRDWVARLMQIELDGHAPAVTFQVSFPRE